MSKWKYAALTAALVITATVIGVSLTSSAKPVETASNKAQQQAKRPTRAELLKLVNAERAKYGVPPLKEDTRLDTSAQRKADDMVKYDYFGHVSPHDGKHGYEYINDVGIYCKTDSENLTEANDDVNTSSRAVEAWVKSPPHHKAMINADYSYTGFGISGGTVVEHFCEQ